MLAGLGFRLPRLSISGVVHMVMAVAPSYTLTPGGACTSITHTLPVPTSYFGIFKLKKILMYYCDRICGGSHR